MSKSVGVKKKSIQCDSMASIIAGFLILFHYNVLRMPSCIEEREDRVQGFSSGVRNANGNH